MKSNAQPQNERPLSSQRVIRSLKAKADAKRTVSEKMADWLTSSSGSMTFLFMNVLWFAAWIIINLDFIPGIKSFDPFPFGLLTMIVSLEAIVLAVVVLISQNRAAKIDDLREEVDLQVDIITEEELTKLMEMVSALMKKQGMDIAKDAAMQEMLKPTDMKRIQKILEREVIDN